MTELCDTCQHGEANILVHAFQVAVHTPQRVAVLLLQIRVIDSLQQRLVVLVNQYDNAFSCLVKGSLYDIPKAHTKIFIRLCDSILLFPLGNKVVEIGFDADIVIVICTGEIEMKHRVFNPAMFYTAYFQSLEQVPTA